MFAPVDEQFALLRRGAVDLVDERSLREKLERARRTATPLTVKAGFDASTPDLHLGHTVLLRKMRHFQDLGHRVVFLIGGFTAMIGDPSGKKTTRPQLTAEEVERNSATYARQVFRVLDRDRTVVDNNNRWLHPLGAEGMIRLAGRYTLARMMEREDFRSRFQNGQAVYLHELLYPLVQGYDSIALKADVELGGHDQIFNLLVGRDLMKEQGLEPQVVLTVPLLVGLDGKEKMSKSLGNAISFEESPREIYGKTMSIPDDLMWDWFLLLTDTEVEPLRREVQSGGRHPMSAKKELARQLVESFHGADAAAAAAQEFERVFSSGGAPEEISEIEVEAAPLARLLAGSGLATSNAEARRLIEQGAVLVDGERRSDPHLLLAARDETYLVKVGKRRFARLRIR